jgi:hypothetical protein
MMRRLSKLELAVSQLSAIAVALAYPFADPSRGFAGFVPFVVVYCFARSTLVMFLLIVKNGGGWPE